MPREGQEGQVVPSIPVYKRHKSTGPQCAPYSFPRNTEQLPPAFKECLLQMELRSNPLQMGLSSGSPEADD